MAGVKTCARLSPRLSPHTPLTRLRIFHTQGARCSSSTTDAPTPAHATFKASDLQIDFCRPEQLRSKPPVKELLFGKSFTDHMLKIYYTKDAGWGAPRITPLQDLRLHPAAKVLHYSVELFEGMKAFRGVDDDIRLFRPEMNMARMNRTAARSALPTFDGGELVTLLKKLVTVDQEWVPHTESSSLYIRPTMIGTEPTLGVVRPAEALLFVILSPVGPYFASGFKPVSLLADPRYVRAWPGGVGMMKMGSNYGPTLEIQRQAEEQGCQQVLWLFGPEHRITEVGAMNIMVYLINKQGEKELVTPPLDGLILPGVTRDSLLTLARRWAEFRVSERDITMREVEEASEEGRLLEMFGAGTAAVVTPVGEIHYQGRVIRVAGEAEGPGQGKDQEVSLAQRFYATITGVQYGKIESDWAVKIDS